MANVVITLVAYVLTIGVLLLWVFLAKQRRVPRTLKTAVGISLRTLPLFLAVLLICQGLGVDVLLAIAILGIGLWVLLIHGGESWFGTVALLYVIQ